MGLIGRLKDNGRDNEKAHDNPLDFIVTFVQYMHTNKRLNLCLNLNGITRKIKQIFKSIIYHLKWLNLFLKIKVLSV